MKDLITCEECPLENIETRMPCSRHCGPISRWIRERDQRIQEEAINKYAEAIIEDIVETAAIYKRGKR